MCVCSEYYSTVLVLIHTLLGAVVPWRHACRYCTNYYGDSAPASAGSDMCDWCLSDVAGGKARWSSSSPAGTKQHATAGSQESSSTTTSSGGSGSGRGAGGGKASGGDQAELAGRRATTRAAGRRYKLLKDVLCE